MSQFSLYAFLSPLSFELWCHPMSWSQCILSTWSCFSIMDMDKMAWYQNINVVNSVKLLQNSVSLPIKLWNVRNQNQSIHTDILQIHKVVTAFQFVNSGQYAGSCLCFDGTCTASMYINGTTLAGTTGKVITPGFVSSVVGSCSSYPLAVASFLGCETVTFPTTGCITSTGSPCHCSNSDSCSITGISSHW